MAGRVAVAVLGAGGTMGQPMARNLARAGLEVRAWNRSRGKAEPLTADGAQVVDSPAEAAQGASVVLTILSDTNAVLSVMTGRDGALGSMADSAAWLQMSTIGEDGTRRCAELAAERKIAFADAPVLGTRKPAEDGTLTVLASGPDSLADRLRPLFGAVGQKTIWVGAAGAGTRLKLVANAWVLSVVEAGAETIALAQGLGLDPQLLFDAIAGGALDLPYLRMKGQAMISRSFEPAFRLRLAAKDAGLIREAARGHGLDLPLLRVVADRMAEGAAAHGDKDFSATYLASAPS